MYTTRRGLWGGTMDAVVMAYLRAELPAWGRVLERSKALSDERWRDAGMVVARGKWHGYEMLLDPGDWSERVFLVVGRYYDLGSQLVMRELLTPGSTFIDVGANIGMLTLLAARLVGPEGRVVSFEPNPEVRARLEENIRRNRIGHVEVRAQGLSDAPGELVLHVPERHSGEGSFAAATGGEGPAIAARYAVRVVRGDEAGLEAAAARPGSRVVLKLDVEGFECRALRGLAGFIGRTRPLVLTEANAEHLGRAGASLDELFGIMAGHGYEAYAVGTRRRGIRRVLALGAVEGPDAVRGTVTDLLWLHGGIRAHPWLKRRVTTGRGW